MTSKSYTFQARARLLELLGEQLIKDAGIAVFELVKNSYDADATEALVTIYDVDSPENARIVIEDTGIGMDLDTIRSVWLEIGTDYRTKQVEQKETTPIFNRMPMGAKGIGRFAVHKLGEEITLITRKKGCSEVIVQINWADLKINKYLQDLKVNIVESEQGSEKRFKNGSTGTYIEITKLKHDWDFTSVRNLHRDLTAISSPFEGPDNFQTLLTLVPDKGWLDGLLNVSDVLEYSLYRVKCELRGSFLDYYYEFTPTKEMVEKYGLNSRKVKPKKPLLIRNGKGKTINLNGEAPCRVGPVDLQLYIYDRDTQILSTLLEDKKGFREFLDENGGIKLYRDCIRVYDYGEKGSDWLDLDKRRINDPSEKIGNSIVLGAASIRLAESDDLIEKTNREGFVQNKAYTLLTEALKFAITQIESERNKDKNELNEALNRKPVAKVNKRPVRDDIATLRQKVTAEVESMSLKEEIIQSLNAVEEQYIGIENTLLTAAGSGLSLASLIHELEKGIFELDKAIQRKANYDDLKKLSAHLVELLEGFSYLIRRSGMKRESASSLIANAIQNTRYRCDRHNIKIMNGLIDIGQSDFNIKCSRRLIISVLINLIDNAIWWIDSEVNENKQIFVGTSTELNGPAIIVADNGPGFIDPSEYLIQPFVTRKPDSMGLGLHIANQVMKHHEGKLVFPEAGNIDLPSGFNGAIVALEFGKQQ